MGKQKMQNPQNLKYTKEHEWVAVDGSKVVVGITQFAADQLGDIVMTELPEVGKILQKDKAFGVVESVKSVSDVFAPLSGKILEINTQVTENPGVINQDPYKAGWLVKMEISNNQELEGLMSADQYTKFLEESH